MKKNKSKRSSILIKVILLFLTSFILAILFIIFFFISSPPSLQILISNQLTSQLSNHPYLDSINTNTFIFQFILTLIIGFVLPFVIYYRHRKKSMKEFKKIIPRLHYLDSGRVDTLERFSHYVARQMGFGDTNECLKMSKLAEEYLRKCKGCEGDIYGFFAKEEDVDLLYVKLVEEFERCILSYFAFHWSQATLMISQILSVDSEPKGRLRNMILAATRKLRFERVTKNLKVARVFSTLVEEMKAIRGPSNDDSQCTDVMIPAAHSERSPVLLLMGGGMGAGKSTVLKDILKESFWSDAAGNAVVVEADAFKETDVIYRALSSRGHHDMLQTAELVHQSSTDAASSLLVTALNEGRDVIMDGTLSWEPFVYQTITMARNVHRHRYRMGAGYKVSEDGTITESYWEQIKEEPGLGRGDKESKKKKPYRIELVGVVCDAYIAVVRGMRRAIMMGRAVRVNSQLRSHKRFANAFPRYCQLVDNARLYCTNDMGVPPQLIGWKDGDNNLLLDPQRMNCLSTLGMLNENADSIYELYNQNDEELDGIEAGSSVWKDIVLSSSRTRVQSELKKAIQKVEKQLEETEIES